MPRSNSNVIAGQAKASAIICEPGGGWRLDAVRRYAAKYISRTHEARSPEQQRQLENSERKWLAWRGQYCSSPPAEDNPERLTETDDLILYQWCYMDSTLERIVWLKQYLRQEEMPPDQAI
jgi:hypothetical protein